MKLHIGVPTAIHQDWMRRMQSLGSAHQPWPTVVVPDSRLARWFSEKVPPGVQFIVIDQWLEECLPQHMTRAPQGTWEFLASVAPDSLLPQRYATVPGIIAAVADLVRRGRRIGVRTVVPGPSDQLPWRDLWRWFDRHLTTAVVDELWMYDYAVRMSTTPSPRRNACIYLYGFAVMPPPLVDLIKAWHAQQPVEIWALQGSLAADPAIWGDVGVKTEVLESDGREAPALWIRPLPATDVLDAAASWVKKQDENLRDTIVVETDQMSAKAWKRALARHELIAQTEMLHDREETLWQLFVAILANGTVRDAMITRWLREAGPLASENWKEDWRQRAINIREWADLADLVREAAIVHSVPWAQAIQWAERVRAWDAFPGTPTPSAVLLQLTRFATMRRYSEYVPIMPVDLAIWVPVRHVVLAGTAPGGWLRRTTHTPFDGDGAIQPWVRISDTARQDGFLIDQLWSDKGWSRWMVSETPGAGIGDAVMMDAISSTDQTTAASVRKWYQAWRDARTHSPYTGWVDASLVGSLMPAQLSPSALEDFGRCPLSFLLRRLLRIPAMEDEAVDVTPQTIGMWAHRALELIVRRGFALTPDAMRQCLDEAIAEYPVSRLVPPFLVEYAADGLSSELYEALVREDWPPQGHTEVEVSLAWEWVWPMQGRVDRIDWMDDGGIRLVDYKTGTVLNPVVPSPANMQLLLYQQALAEHYGVPVEAELYGISQKSRFMRRRVSHAAGVAQREVIRSIAEGIRTRIREGKFWPVPDAKIQPCRLCAYRLVCPDQVVQEASVKNASDEEFLALWDAGKDSAHDAD